MVGRRICGPPQASTTVIRWSDPSLLSTMGSTMTTTITPVHRASDHQSVINDTIIQTIDLLGEDNYLPIDLPEDIRDLMRQAGLPTKLPFPVFRFGKHWALIKVPERRWKRLRSQFPQGLNYHPGGEEPRFHLYPLTDAARLFVTFAIFPGRDGLMPSEIVVDEHADSKRLENPSGFRFMEIHNLDLVLSIHEELVDDFELEYPPKK